MNTTLLEMLARNWWLLLLRGICAIILGLLAFAWPGLTLVVLVLLYGAYAAADGVLALAAAVAGGTMAPRWWLALAGLIGLGVAAVTFFYPGVTIVVLLTFVGIMAIVRGVIEIVGAIQLRREIHNEWWLILAGVMSIVFGGCIIARPGVGAVALVWMMAAYAIAAGLLIVGFAMRLRKHAPRHA
jgi:uncharacterized membrane protein HdeD (DUF308 family)